MDDMNLIKLVEQFSDEAACRDHLAELRWPDGPVCPRCQSKKINGPSKRHLYECECGYQFSVKVGTIFNDSKLPLWKWFVATYLICESKKGMSANQLKRTLGVSYKTAWYLCHRIRSAMTQDETPLGGIVEADETFIGGRNRTPYRTRQERALHRYDNKTTVLGAVERGGRVRFRVSPDTSSKSIKGFLGDVVDDDAKAIYTDSLRSYRGVGDHNTVHAYVDHSKGEYVRGQIHTNTVESVWSLFDRSVIGAYHKLSVKHLPAYLDEAAFRWNNRSNPYLFRDTILRLVEGDALTFETLTKPAVD